MSTASARPRTRVRWHISVLLFCVVVLTFLDRMNMSVAARYIQLEFGLSNAQIGFVLSAYVVGYALFQIPGGLMGDHLGPRKLLAFAVAWWSVFTALTALAPGIGHLSGLGLLGGFFTMRFLVGVGEAAALPNCNKTVAQWMSPSERGIGASLFLTGIGFGGAISQPLIATLMAHLGWRWPFALCGLLGAPVFLVWWWYGRDCPESHPRVNPAELAYIRRDTKSPSQPEKSYGSFKLAPFLGERTLWALLLSYFLQGYVIYIFYTWFYLYVVTVKGFNIQTGGLWASAPFIAVAVTTPLGGLASDACVRRFGYAWGRRVPAIAGTFGSGFLLIAGARVAQAQLAVILLGLAAGSLNFALTNWWATINDISPGNSGTLSGIMNTAGSLGGVVSPMMTPWIAGRFGWTHALDFAAAVVMSAGVLWLLIRSGKREFPAETKELQSS
jgi:ACS family glucarate transporter-like MFS transporter